MRWKQFVISKSQLGVLLILLALAFGACNRGHSQGVRFASTSDPGLSNAPINNEAPGNSLVPVLSYADIVSRVSPAVITIHSEMRVRAPQQYPFMDDPMFRQFFGDRLPQQMPEQRRSGLGSGVIISTGGY
ncbi:MAG TPA: hypothetical protein VIF64_22315, partial [Pyrinomonadaceae bacterium]